MARDDVPVCDDYRVAQYERPLMRLYSPNRIPTAVGGAEKQEYQPVYDRKGVWHLEATKMSNRYMEIQSHADSCDLNVIMQRYQRGELDVLQQVQGYYGDVSNIPSNYADILNETIRGEALFRSLAPDIRSQFGNSVEQFVAALGDGSAWDILGYTQEQVDSASASADAEKEVES